MSVSVKKGLSCLLLLALLLSALSGAAWAEGIEELELEMLEIAAYGDVLEDEDAAIEETEGDAPPVVEIDGEPASDEGGDTEPEGDAPQPPAEEESQDETADDDVPETEPAPEEPDESEAKDPEPDGTENGNTLPETVYLSLVSNSGTPKVRLYAELAVDENFRINLYISLPADADPAQYRVKTVFEAQMSERVIDRSLSAEDREDELYVIPDICQARIYQLTAPIDITVTRGGTELRHEIYSVRDYLEELARVSKPHEAFCIAALCYGGAAQRWLEGQSFLWDEEEYEYEVFIDDLADKEFFDPDPPYPLPDPARPLHETVFTGGIDGLGNLAARYQIGLETALRFYFSYPQNPAPLTFSTEGHVFNEPASQAAAFWYVDLPGIRATELANDFVVNVTRNYQQMTILYSPFCYAAQHWYGGDMKLTYLCRMLVAFGNEAAALAAAVKE